MSQPFLGEIRMVGFNFAPTGWAFCNGQLLPIAQNTALFDLIGTFYGGDGVENFALPNLQSRVAIHMGQGTGLSPYVIGQLGGVENVTLLSTQLPGHTHPVACSSAAGTQASPVGGVPAIESTGTSLNFTGSTPNATMNAAMIAPNSGGQPHPNIQPYLCITFIIALEGIFPSRS